VLIIITNRTLVHGLDTMNTRASDRVYSIATDTIAVAVVYLPGRIVTTTSMVAVAVVYQQWGPCHPYIVHQSW
jgi:hypothetical protein